MSPPWILVCILLCFFLGGGEWLGVEEDSGVSNRNCLQ